MRCPPEVADRAGADVTGPGLREKAPSYQTAPFSFSPPGCFQMSLLGVIIALLFAGVEMSGNANVHQWEEKSVFSYKTERKGEILRKERERERESER